MFIFVATDQPSLRPLALMVQRDLDQIMQGLYPSVKVKVDMFFPPYDPQEPPGDDLIIYLAPMSREEYNLSEQIYEELLRLLPDMVGDVFSPRLLLHERV